MFVNSISFTEAYFGKFLLSGDSYVSDCLAVFLGVSPALGMVWCLFIQHQRTSYIAQITHDAEREMHEV